MSRLGSIAGAVAATVVLIGTLSAATNNSQDYTQTWRCGGEPYYDARCSGAVGDGVTDDAAALLGAWNVAKAAGWNLYLPHKTFKLSTTLVLPWATAVPNGIISNGAILDASGYVSGPALTFTCGTVDTCAHNYIQGPLTVKSAATNAPGFQFGIAALTDTFTDFQTTHRVTVINSGAGAGPTGCAIGSVITSHLKLWCQGQANGYGAALSFVRQSIVELYATSPTRSLGLINSLNYDNTFPSAVLEGGGDCLVISTASLGNTFHSPRLSNCAHAVNMTAGSNNTLIGPDYSSPIGTNTTGLTVVNASPDGKFALVPAATGLPQITVGGTPTSMGVAAATLAPVTAPASPTSGSWVLYVDTSDGKLKVKYSDGTVRTLAVHP